MGRLPSRFGRKYQLQRLNPTHDEIIRLRLLGYRPKQIAELLGVTVVTVGNAVNGAEGQAKLAILRQHRDESSCDMNKRFAEFAPTCFDVVQDLVEDENQPKGLRAKYALEMLGVAGYVKPQRVQAAVTVSTLTTDEIKAIKERAMALTAGEVIDGDFKTLPPSGDLATLAGEPQIDASRQEGWER